MRIFPLFLYSIIIEVFYSILKRYRYRGASLFHAYKKILTSVILQTAIVIREISGVTNFKIF